MDYQFYPTPRPLAHRLWALFKNKDFQRVLEPHGGNGDLIDASPLPMQRTRTRGTQVDCCEIDIARHPILREKDINVVGTDFMQLKSAAIYSHVIANPPFADGVKHLLHAYSILWEGEIAFILNAQTIRNPCTRERRHLVDLIKRYGSVEFSEGEFEVDEAKRKTTVEVALVWLHKKVDVEADILGNLLDDLKVDASTEETLAAGFEERRELMLPTTVIENAVVAFNAANKSMREAVMAEAKARYYAAILGETLASRNHDGPKAAPQQSIDYVRKTVATRYLELKDRAWAGILRSTNVTSRLSSQAQKRIESEFADLKALEFTLVNIYGFLCGLCDSAGAIQIGMACDVFDLFTKYHTENRIFYRGWVSNNRHRAAGMRLRSTRFILPGHGVSSYANGLSYESERLLDDIDKVFSMLDGKSEPETSLRSVFNTHFQELRAGKRIASSYFGVRWFRGVGTIHFYPLSQVIVDRLNRLVGRHRQWLPPEGERVSDAFWLQYEKAEKYQAELLQEVALNNGNNYNNPLRKLSQDDTSRQEALEQIGIAMSTVLERNGIDVDLQLDGQENSPLFLMAA
jgi:hypothetical protein